MDGVERELPFENLEGINLDGNLEEIDEFFVNFFEVFGNESIANGIEIADGDIVSTGGGVLVMRCPLTGKDVNVMNSSTWKSIHGEYMRARDLLRAGFSLDDLV